MLRNLRIARAAFALGWESGRFWWTFPLAVSVAAGFIPALGALLTRSLVDALAHGSPSTHHLVLLGLGVAFSGATAQVLGFIASYASNVAKQRLTILAGRRLLHRVASFNGLRYFDDPSFHDRLALAEQTAQTSPSLVTTSLQQIVQAIVVIATFVGTLLVVWPPMAPLLAIAVVPALAMQLIRAQEMATTTRTFMPLQRRAALYWRWFFDPRSAKEMRVFGFSQLFADRYSLAVTERSRALLRVERRNTTVRSLLTAANGVIASIGLVIVSLRVHDGALSIGDLVLFAAALGAVQGALSGIVMRSGDIASALRLFPTYLDVVNAPEDIPPIGAKPDALREAIVFNDVWFRYRPDAPWVLRGLNLVIPAGSSLGVVGLNGAGKTTIIKLLLRFYDPNSGVISWDGTDIRLLHPGQLRERVACLFQDFQNYDLTVRENIGIGAPKWLDDRDRIETAAAQAGVAATVERLPHGYDSMLSLSFDAAPGKPGTTLSGGQWQRVALARAMLRTDADVILLDEPTSSLDPEAEHELRELSRRFSTSRTTVMVSHRLAALAAADEIVVVDEGRIVESGSHSELIARGGMYARLFQMQAGRSDVATSA